MPATSIFSSDVSLTKLFVPLIIFLLSQVVKNTRIALFLQQKKVGVDSKLNLATF